MRSDDVFDLKPEHVTLLRAAYVGWEDSMAGAPCIDPKRPYGNSFVLSDLHKLVHGREWDWDEDGDMPDDVSDELLRLHRETQTALQVIITTGSFEPGRYVKRERYSARSWEQQDA